MAEVDDLLRRCQQGDASALSVLVRLLQDRLFRLAFRVIGDAGRAEEATADALLKVWDRCGSWREEASATTWIYRVALRTILDRARRRPWWQLGTVEALPDVADPAALGVNNVIAAENQQQMRRRLEAAFRQLSEEDRALLHLYYFEQKSLAELEPILDASSDALKMRLSRARQRLKPLLEGCDDLL